MKQSFIVLLALVFSSISVPLSESGDGLVRIPIVKRESVMDVWHAERSLDNSVVLAERSHLEA